MPKFQPPSAELVARFDALLPKAASVERRRMFGCPCAFLNGNMFTGLHEQRLIVRLGEAKRAALLTKPGTEPFAVTGRTMREYVAFAKALEHTPRELSGWIKKAFDFAQTLPPKNAAARGLGAGTVAARKPAACRSRERSA